MITTAKYTVILFGVFFIAAGFLMLFAPEKARQTLRKAGSTNFINYAELTIRMIPGLGLIIYSDFSKFPEAFKICGWFILVSSLVLCIIPRQLHHNYSLKCADILKPLYFQLISPFSMAIGIGIIYCTI
ncbi:hypothetical protein ABGT15_07585 [Flavobacterium enshiense]|uniref:hypothetical protein n=1 Tax=Flavobacterium enshiense TaxID=1341165 RepID=UPI00345CD908